MCESLCPPEWNWSFSCQVRVNTEGMRVILLMLCLSVTVYPKCEGRDVIHIMSGSVCALAGWLFSRHNRELWVVLITSSLPLASLHCFEDAEIMLIKRHGRGLWQTDACIVLKCCWNGVCYDHIIWLLQPSLSFQGLCAHPPVIAHFLKLRVGLHGIFSNRFLTTFVQTIKYRQVGLCKTTNIRPNPIHRDK